MTDEEARRLLADELGRIAPDIDFASVDPQEDLRDAFDIDSMDFLNLVTALSQRLGISIPEADYPRLGSVAEAADYLRVRTEPQR